MKNSKFDTVIIDQSSMNIYWKQQNGSQKLSHEEIQIIEAALNEIIEEYTQTSTNQRLENNNETSKIQKS